MEHYGFRVYREGVDFHPDRRVRDVEGSAFLIPSRPGRFADSRRGRITGLSRGSARRLEFIAANVGTSMGWLITLTYRENPANGETDEERNYRVARRSKADLNGFLVCVRHEIGAYIWVQEFQERGVVHYHVLCEREITEQRARVVWCRKIGALGDAASLNHAVKVEPVKSSTGARSYVGRYFGKERQKKLPEGVSGAGRWWGRSRGLALALVEEVVTCQAKAQENNGVEVWVTRQVRRFLSRRFGREFRGGFFVDWGGELSEQLARMTRELRQWFMDFSDREQERIRRLLHEFEWESVLAAEGHEGEVRGGEVREKPGTWFVECELGLDRETAERARKRWEVLYGRRWRGKRVRRGMWVDYRPSDESEQGVEEDDAGGKKQVGRGEAQLYLGLGKAASGCERDSA